MEKLLCADLGGTRLKLGIVRDGQVESFQIISSPLFKDLPQVIKNYYNEHQADNWTIGMPGDVQFDKETWIKTETRFKDDSWSIEKLNNYFVKFGLKKPLMIVNDTDPLAIELVGENESGTFCQISTSLGVRIVEEGKIKREEDNFTMFLDDYICDKEVEMNGAVKSYEEWAGFRESQKWLPQHLKNIPISQLVKRTDKEINLIQDVLIKYIQEVETISPYSENFVIGGGGALAFKERLLPHLSQNIRWAENAHTPGILGLAKMVYKSQK